MAASPLLTLLPQDLLGVLYSLLDRNSRRAFISCCSAVRRAPGVLAHITCLSISAERLQHHPGENPLASLPPGVHLKRLRIGKDFCSTTGSISLADLLCPKDSMRARVQDVVKDLQFLELETEQGPSQDPHALGACVRQLPLLRHLKINGMHYSDVLVLLESMAEGGVQTLESFEFCSYSSAGMNLSNDVVSALVPFKRLSQITLDCPATNYSPLMQLPALKVLRVLYPNRKYRDFFETLPHMLQLEMLCMRYVPEMQTLSVIKSASLQELSFSYCTADDSLPLALDLVCAGELPGLRVMRVSTLSAYFSDVSSARDTGTALAAKLERLPLLSVTIGEIDEIIHFDAFLEICLMTPILWGEVQSIGYISSDEFPATRLREVSHVFANLIDVGIRNCSPEEVLALSDALSGFRCLQFIQVNINSEHWTPGLATSLLSLCVEASSLLVSSNRAHGLHVGMRVDCDDADEVEEVVERVDAELNILQSSWAKTKALIERLGHSCRVDLEAEPST